MPDINFKVLADELVLSEGTGFYFFRRLHLLHEVGQGDVDYFINKGGLVAEEEVVGQSVRHSSFFVHFAPGDKLQVLCLDQSEQSISSLHNTVRMHVGTSPRDGLVEWNPASLVEQLYELADIAVFHKVWMLGKASNSHYDHLSLVPLQVALTKVREELVNGARRELVDALQLSGIELTGHALVLFSTDTKAIFRAVALVDGRSAMVVLGAEGTISQGVTVLIRKELQSVGDQDNVVVAGKVNEVSSGVVAEFQSIQHLSHCLMNGVLNIDCSHIDELVSGFQSIFSLYKQGHVFLRAFFII